MVHPELSEGGTCGLCIAAATRLYRKADLMPLHARCHCLPHVVLAGQEDLAQVINGMDLDELYAAIGATRREELVKTRVKVVQHGELGPVLVQEGHAFRGPDQVRADAGSDTPIGEQPDRGGEAPSVPGPREAGTDGSGRGGGDVPFAGPSGGDEPLLPDSTVDAALPSRLPEAEHPRRRPVPTVAELRAVPGRVASDVEPDGHFDRGRGGRQSATDYSERRVAARLRALGYTVWSVEPIDEQGVRTPDAVVLAPDGREFTVEFKVLDAPTSGSVRDSIGDARGQSERVVIDGVGAGLMVGEAAQGLARMNPLFGAEVREILLLGPSNSGFWRLRWI